MGDQSKVSQTRNLLEPQNGYGPIVSDAWYAQAKRENLNSSYLQQSIFFYARTIHKLKMHQQNSIVRKMNFKQNYELQILMLTYQYTSRQPEWLH